MAATSPRDRLLRALLLAATPAVAFSAYACDDGPSAGEAPGNELATAGSAGASTATGSAGTSATTGSAGTSATTGSAGTTATTGSAGTTATGSAGTSATPGAGGSSLGVGGSGGITGTPGVAGSGGAATASFPPVPTGTGEGENGYPQCGPDQTKPGGGRGFHGSCCVDLYCIPFVDGSCPAAKDVRRGMGSGTCGCDTTTGPYDPGEMEPVADSKGKDCCYLAGIIGCDGRPLLIAGVARVAGLAVSSGWS